MSLSTDLKRALGETRSPIKEESSETVSERVHSTLNNIRFDPHMHSGFSDGLLYLDGDLASVRELGLKGFAPADHHRDSLDEVKLYGREGYIISSIDEPLADNMQLYLDEITDIGIVNEREASDEDVEHYLKNLGVVESKEQFLDSQNYFEQKKSIERDYETWRDSQTRKFIDSPPKIDGIIQENKGQTVEELLDHIVLSSHYFPEDFLEKDSNQYIRSANLADRPTLGVEDAVEWYKQEQKLKLLRAADLTEVARDKREIFDEYNVDTQIFDRLDVDLDFEVWENDFDRPIAGNLPVIHSHWDLIFTNDETRRYIDEEDVEEYLGLAEELDQVVEINGRIMKKLDSKDLEQGMDSEWFARKVLEYSEESDLDYTVASDAHYEGELQTLLTRLDNIIDRYTTTPLDADQLYDNSSTNSTNARLLSAT